MTKTAEEVQKTLGHRGVVSMFRDGKSDVVIRDTRKNRIRVYRQGFVLDQMEENEKLRVVWDFAKSWEYISDLIRDRYGLDDTDEQILSRVMASLETKSRMTDPSEWSVIERATVGRFVARALVGESGVPRWVSEEVEAEKHAISANKPRT